MNIEDLVKLASSFFNNNNLNNSLNNIQQKKMNFNDYTKEQNNNYNQNNFSNNNTYTNQQCNIETKDYNNYPNFPPPLETKTKIQNTTNIKNTYDLFPQAIPQTEYTNNYNNQNNNFNNNNYNQNNNYSSNIKNPLSQILSNPETLNMIKQILPLFQQSSSGGNQNFLSNILGGFKKNNNIKESNTYLSEKEQKIDIDKLIKIDDA